MQLSLPLRLGIEYGERNFVISSCNHQAYRAVSSKSLYNDRILLVGDKGSGKTHLSYIWSARNSAVFINKSFRFDLYENLILENIDKVCACEDGEEFLFHLINFCNTNCLKLLLTSSTMPSFKLKDLRSRISATPCFIINSPDEELIKFVMLKQFSDKQLEVPFNVIEYSAKFLRRDFMSIGEFVREIDTFSLSRKRNITLPLVKEYFEEKSNKKENSENVSRETFFSFVNNFEDERITA